LYDEYHKTQILKNLDLHFLSELSGEYQLLGERSAKLFKNDLCQK